jgi:hypothetical protein
MYTVPSWLPKRYVGLWLIVFATKALPGRRIIGKYEKQNGVDLG